MNISSVIANHVSMTEFVSLPKDAIDAAKRSFLDTLAVARAGFNAPGINAAASLYLEQGGYPQSTLWADNKRLPAISATVINGLAAAALDYDGLHPIGLVHPGIVTIPAALAVSECVHASGRQFLTAVALADDLMCRMALSHKERRGWNFTAVYGGLAASIAAAKILGLNAQQIRDTIGLAFLTASGTQQPAAERSLAKRMQSAHAAGCGVWAALMAEKGYNGPSEVFEGKFGLYNLYEPGDSEEITKALGVRFENTQICVKKYPSCGCSHAVLDGLLEIISAHGVTADQVESVETIISPYMHRLVGAPFSLDGNPQVTAQFSIQYAVACALLFRQFSLNELRTEQILDPSILNIIKRIKIVVDPENEGGVAPAEVKVKTINGAVLRRRIQDLKGTPNNPFTEFELEQKFVDCVTYGDAALTRASARAFYLVASQVEDIDDMSRFFERSMLESTAVIGTPTEV